MLIAIVGCKDSDRMSQDDIALVRALEELNSRTERPIWNDPSVDWSKYGLVVLRSVWDYHLQHEEFQSWLEHVETFSTVVNDPATIRWNIHKRYLLELSERGVPTVPTVLCPQGAASWPDAARQWTRAVVKPAVSASAHSTFVVDSDSPEALDRLQGICKTGDALIQPFLSAVQTRYEISLVYIDGEFTHAVRKRANNGDFRVQFEFGGTYELAHPSDSERRTADLAMQNCGHSPIFVRVDICQTDDGRDVLMELEMIEPELWLSQCPDACNALALAIQRRAEALSGSLA